jgi:hypothetical protein
MTAELHPAYVWDCDACGTENFCRAVVYEFSPDERAEMAAEHGLDGVTGEWMSRPDAVQCRQCGKTYDARDPREDPCD